MRQTENEKNRYFIKNRKIPPSPCSGVSEYTTPQILCFPGQDLAGRGCAYGSWVRARAFRQSFMASEPRGAEYPVSVVVKQQHTFKAL